MVLDGKDVITIAATGSGILDATLVHQVQLLGNQFVDILEKNLLCAVSMTAANATNELFEVSNLK